MKVNYHIDKFVDNNGIEREFILAAVSIDLKKDSSVNVEDAYATIFKSKSFQIYPVTKVLCLGISVKRPEDTFDEERGMQIAKGKALKVLKNPKKGKIIFASESGLVNTKMVQAILEQEALYFKRNPRCYIANYGKQTNKE